MNSLLETAGGFPDHHGLADAQGKIFTQWWLLDNTHLFNLKVPGTYNLQTTLPETNLAIEKMLSQMEGH